MRSVKITTYLFVLAAMMPCYRAVAARRLGEGMHGMAAPRSRNVVTLETPKKEEPPPKKEEALPKMEEVLKDYFIASPLDGIYGMRFGELVDICTCSPSGTGVASGVSKYTFTPEKKFYNHNEYTVYALPMSKRIFMIRSRNSHNHDAAEAVEIVTTLFERKFGVKPFHKSGKCESDVLNGFPCDFGKKYRKLCFSNAGEESLRLWSDHYTIFFGDKNGKVEQVIDINRYGDVKAIDFTVFADYEKEIEQAKEARMKRALETGADAI